MKNICVEELLSYKKSFFCKVKLKVRFRRTFDKNEANANFEALWSNQIINEGVMEGQSSKLFQCVRKKNVRNLHLATYPRVIASQTGIASVLVQASAASASRCTTPAHLRKNANTDARFPRCVRPGKYKTRGPDASSLVLPGPFITVRSNTHHEAIPYLR